MAIVQKRFRRGRDEPGAAKHTLDGAIGGVLVGMLAAPFAAFAATHIVPMRLHGRHVLQARLRSMIPVNGCRGPLVLSTLDLASSARSIWWTWVASPRRL